MKKSVMQNLNSNSPLARAQGLKYSTENQSRPRPELSIPLPLTSLIDAFSIIVIYLLIGTQSGEIDTKISDQMKLPMAESGAGIYSESQIVRIEKGVYFINDQQVSASNLGKKLTELRLNISNKEKDKEIAIMIQADQAMDYAMLDPLLRAGSEAGIQKMKFAVIPKQ